MPRQGGLHELGGVRPRRDFPWAANPWKLPTLSLAISRCHHAGALELHFFGVRELDVERSRMKMPIEIMPVHVNLEGDVQRVLILPKMIFKLTIFVKACIIEDSSFDASRDSF